LHFRNLLDEKERRRKREFDFRKIQMKRPQDIQREEEARFAERARMVMEMGLVNEVKTTTMMTTPQNIQNAAEIGKEEENEELLRVEITFFKSASFGFGRHMFSFTLRFAGMALGSWTSTMGRWLLRRQMDIFWLTIGMARWSIWKAMSRRKSKLALEGSSDMPLWMTCGFGKIHNIFKSNIQWQNSPIFSYMAHGLEFGPRDAADFGRAEKIQQQMVSIQRLLQRRNFLLIIDPV
jgi:hypothetical protein